MDVGHGGGGETAEWVNALLAAFWSLLQPIVTRFNFTLVTAHGKFVNNQFEDKLISAIEA